MIKVDEKYKMIYITEDLDEGVKVAFSTKHGGVSRTHLASMNMSYNREDDVGNVDENYRRLKEVMGISDMNLYMVHQVHGDRIRTVTGKESPGYFEEARFDAQITNIPGSALAVNHADCTPLLFYDGEKRAIAAVHSGWKSTLLEIAAKTVREMNDRFGTEAGKLKVWIGPSISSECYEVKEDVYTQFKEQLSWAAEGFFKQQGEGSYLLDVRGIVKESLLRCGVKNIKDMGFCTWQNSGLFFSHRRDKGHTGTMTGIISLK